MSRLGHQCLSALLLSSFVFFAFSVGPAATKRAGAGTFKAANSQDVRRTRFKIHAAQFLSKATFGPSMEDIDSLANRISQIGYKRAFSEWIDKQFELPASSHEQVARDLVALNNRVIDQEGIGISQYRYQAWWHIALTGDDQLRQRVAWALSQIFVIGDTGVGFNNEDDRSIGNDEMSIPDWLGMSDYYDMLAGHADGNYRDLLGDVTFHPCMGVWLSSLQNRKANVASGRYPDENYAREIMQLFSVGLYKLRQDGRLELNDQGELIPTYDNEGIKELARVFTGFKNSHNTSTNFYVSRNFGQPMVLHGAEHDSNYDYSEDPGAPASKTIFGETLPPLPFPVSNEAATAEVEAALDIIANQDNVGPFVCRRLIQRLVKSNPSRAYLRRVTRVWNNNGQGVRGDMKAVIKAILIDPEVFRGKRLMRKRGPDRIEVVTRGTEHCRLREPILRVTSMIRALNPSSNYERGYMMLSSSIGGDLGQMPFRSPSVFNFYLPDYQPPGELTGHKPSRRIPYNALFAPEFQILTAVTANRTINRFKTFCRNRYVQYGMRVGTCRITFGLDEELQMARDLGNLPAILEKFDLLLCAGTLSELSKQNIIDAITLETAGADYRYVGRLEEALLAVLLSPNCVVEE